MDKKVEAILYDKLDDNKVQCNLCPRRCFILPDKAGYCGVRQNIGGELFSLIYGKVASVNVDPIEKKPLFHFYPGSSVLSLGTIGCNMRCIHCQNWQISHVVPVKGIEKNKIYNIVEELPTKDISPEEAIASAKSTGCKGIAWTYNEPTIWMEYVIDCARLAKENGLYTAFISNGYMTEEALNAVGPYLDALRIDAKGFTNEFYKNLAEVPNWETILNIAELAKNKWKMHVEIVTLVIPTWNDDDEQLRSIADWIVDSLGEMTPWHVTRFVPHLELDDIPLTSVETLEKAQKIGYESGLKYVYIGNLPGHDGENTYCHNCKELLIKRAGYEILQVNVLKNGTCRKCKTKIGLRF